MKKQIFILSLLFCGIVSAWGQALPSGELFGTYQAENVVLNKTDGTDPQQLGVNCYVAICGQAVMLRTKSTGDTKFDGAGWATQLRVETDGRVEVQACTVVDEQNHYTGVGCQQTITTKEENLTMHFFAFCVGNEHRQTSEFAFNRFSINNPTSDATAPVLDIENTTIIDNGTNLVVTFGEVTADDEYFYYFADKEHNIGSISLTNEITISKPTIQDGTTYTFRAYAVDFNGNMSGYKEYSFTMPYDPTINLALNKPTYAGYSAENGKDAVVDGKMDTRWSSNGGTHYPASDPTDWWYVDLGNSYVIKEIDVWYETACPTNYDILGSNDGESWSVLGTYSTQPKTGNSEDNKNVYDFSTMSPSARYVKLFAREGYNNFAYGISIYEFQVYGSGLAVADRTAPEFTLSVVGKTVNTVTLGMIATDKDDLGNEGKITSIRISDVNNGLAETECISTWKDNQITISDLIDNTTYSFKVVIADAAGNTTEKSIVVELPFNVDLNLALNKPCTGGYCQFNNDTPESRAEEYKKANDGNKEISYSAFGAPDGEAWWQVDLGNMFSLRQIDVTWASDFSDNYTVYGSYNNVDWFELAADAATAQGLKSTALNAAARYVKVVSAKNNVVFTEVEIYASGWGATDTQHPVISSFEVTPVDVTSVCLHVSASDVDDNSNPQPLTYKVSGDNGFVEQAIILDSENKVTLTGLKKNRDYTFIVTATDPATNSTTSDPVAVRMIFDATDNLALNKPSEAGIHQDANIASQANDGDESNFWTSFGQGTKDQWWWKVDLGASFNINRVRILFNDHNGTYNLYSSEDGETWNNYAINFAIDDTNIDYTINVVTSTRYFKFTSTSANVGVKEFEVYGTGYNDGDEEAPVITAAALVGEAEENTATVSVTATDNVGVYACRFVDAANTYDQTFEYVTGENIVVTGLVPGTEYNFTITAIDRAENVSEGFEMDAFTTKANDNVPHTAAPTPIHAQMEVLSIYSDKFTSAVKTPFSWTSWGGVTVYTQGNIGGNNYVHYVFGGHGEIGIGDKFVDASTDTEGIDVSLMQYLHVDIWSLTSEQINITLNNAEVASNIQLTAGEWTSFNIALADFATAHLDILNALQWMKFTGCQNKTIAVDNIYFYNETTEITIDEEQDNSLVISGFDGREMDVTLNRTFARDGYNYTLCLPFDLPEDQMQEAFGADYKLWKLDDAYMKSAEVLYLDFKEVRDLEAGKPYIFCPAVVGAAIVNPIIAGVTINATASTTIGNDVAKMTGIYSPYTLPVVNNYVLGDDNWLYQSNGDEMKGLRCYFTFGSGVSQNVRARAVFHNTDVVTDLEPIDGAQCTMHDGKYVINGQFVIIRNGQRYNAQGQVAGCR